MWDEGPADSDDPTSLPSTSGEPASANPKGDHNADDDNLMCRVCRGNEGNLYYPCLCTGSIKYVHQECLTEWLKYSKKEVCELCNYKYSFQAIYRSDMPKALPIKDIVKGIAVNAFRVVKTWVVYSMVLMAWACIVPITAARIYNVVFYASLNEFATYPSILFRTDNLFIDLVKGCVLLIIFVSSFISLVWLREQILTSGPQDFLNIPAGEAPQQNADAAADGFANDGDGNGGDEEEEEEDDQDDEHDRESLIDDNEEEQERARRAAESDDELLEMHVDYNAAARRRLEQVRRRNEQLERGVREVPEVPRRARPANNNFVDLNVNAGDAGGGAAAADDDGGDGAADDGWRDWDRLGDELTWQRLLGLDGSLVFIEHVFWVISLNTLFTIIFCYFPYRLGFTLLTLLGVQQQLHYFPSIAAIICGYFVLTFVVYYFHVFCEKCHWKILFRLTGIGYLVLKVFLLVLLEIGMFPIICGTWIDLCSMSLFQTTLSTRLQSFAQSPSAAVFIRWLIGMVYVFYSASFVLLLREVLRPGVLWFLRNLNDPEFNPIQEMIDLPASRHVQRIVASTFLFFSTIFLIVYLPLRIIRRISPTTLPYNVSWSADTPLSELSLELLILQVVLPALLEQTHARVVLKAAVKSWCQIVGRAVKLERYLLPDEDADAPAPNAPPPNVAELGGGLAAEHQALLLVREPQQPAHPYEKPSLFLARIAALVVCLSFTWTLCSTLGFYLPVTLGRILIRSMTGLTNVHDLYTAGCGLYMLWSTFRVLMFVSEWLSMDVNEMKDSVCYVASLISRLVLILVPTVLVIPMLLGTFFNLVMMAPLRLEHEQSALFFIWQDWAMGVLHFKILLACVMMGPEWWLRSVCDRIYQDGLRNLRAVRILCVAVLPVVIFLATLLAIPHLIANLYALFTGATMEQYILFHRLCYPTCFIILIAISFIVWQYQKFKGLADTIRNEKYLVGTRLVNYEREKTD